MEKKQQDASEDFRRTIVMNQRIKNAMLNLAHKIQKLLLLRKNKSPTGWQTIAPKVLSVCEQEYGAPLYTDEIHGSS